MTREEFSGVTFIDLDLPGTWISRSSEFIVVNSTEFALNIHTAQSAHFMNEDYLYFMKTTEKIIMYATNTESG